MTSADCNPSGIYLLKVNNKNTRTRRCDICSKLTIKTPERRRSGVFIVNFASISHLVLVFLLLTLNMQLPAGKKTCSSVSIVNFEHVIAGWEEDKRNSKFEDKC